MEQKFGTKINNASEAKNPTTAPEETGNYLGLNFISAPKKNHDALEQIGKPFAQLLKKHGVRTEIYYLGITTTSEQDKAPEGIESIAKKLSIGEDEELWVQLNYYRDRAHADEVYSKMMKDESVGALMKEFDGLVTQGSSLIMGGFSRLRV
jgi:uncharacterized protein YbaA (DUF1428 family)